MESEINPANASQPIPQTNQIPNQPILEPQNNKLVKMFLYVLGAIVFMAIGALGYSLYQSRVASEQVAPNQPDTESLTTQTPTNNPPSPTTKPSITTSAQEKIYENNTFNISLKYPKDWLGPEVYEYKDGFYFEVGTDTVYPYGTDRLDRVYSKENSYFITFQFTKRPDSQTIEQYRTTQPWLQEYLSYLSLKDGESKSDARSLITRVKSVRVGNYSGIEYISTLSETAQTEMFYARGVFLINNNYDTIRISGSPNNVDIQDKKIWKTYYQTIDQENLDSFEKFVSSISV